MSAVNAFILHQSYKQRKVLLRVDFMKALARQLTQPYLRQRMANTGIPRTLRQAIGHILGTGLPTQILTEDRLSWESRKRSLLCPALLQERRLLTFAHCVVVQFVFNARRRFAQAVQRVQMMSEMNFLYVVVAMMVNHNFL
ncbi:hypothetical protein PR048_021097 [Dryococelus australis]|uniref:Uncharacterized protein n=1 Tax=Dryococelus australis TaxID=614101 RepID=A0ABQ9GXA0_9NEOP|nr:hypothetical protein PR048_021097 [Dryococelus australis]